MSARAAQSSVAAHDRGLLVAAEVQVRGVSAQVHVAPGEVVALLGANGAGKSTLLGVAAGMLRPDRGRVELDGEVLLAVGSSGGSGAVPGGPMNRPVDLPPHRRGVALLAQEPLLFPHLSVLDNVAFGPRAAGASRRAARDAAARWLERVDLTHLADRRPGQLSGGQAQRVAVARALAAQPRALLLDEPMAALDVTAAPEVRQLLRRVLSEAQDGAGPGQPPQPPVLLVTHDPLDALALADRAVVLDAGHVVEEGPVREVLSQPRSAFAARLAELNLLAGTAAADGLRAESGPTVAGVLDPGCSAGDAAVAVFPPAAVAIHREHPATGVSSPRNTIPVLVSAVEPRGALVRVRGSVEADPASISPGNSGPGDSGPVDSGPVGHPAAAPVLAADITAASAADLDLVPGSRVWFAVKAAEVAVHAARR
ncbi:molybdate transport system ATP-binding protein [Quadrisphaera granulorum]|uniref:Molybdate transport system ATP-binding protein n=1 Tax=Quadrisphaera granulorum TaxID=317664 RepID=A0A315ZMU8_9ACTN|nr:ATP-binding cassette domain-containing protein [Quadrisphaera granulorum]PWJ46310.1 molybdate transport system ATP-binding protein [Quadrisphaera granulorum]SZE99071.1 molybdate transport system ATP-binding protein [Quadrisphaera granulorum]